MSLYMLARLRGPFWASTWAYPVLASARLPPEQRLGPGHAAELAATYNWPVPPSEIGYRPESVAIFRFLHHHFIHRLTSPIDASLLIYDSGSSRFISLIPAKRRAQNQPPSDSAPHSSPGRSPLPTKL
jgi:hypothetical protein